MFSFSGNLLAGQHDTRKERPPPSRPIPVTFPVLHPPQPSTSAPPEAWTPAPNAGISTHFLGVKRPSDVSDETLALLNIAFQPECDLETLFASLPNSGYSHLPPKAWLDPPEQPQVPSRTPVLSNGRNAPDRREFHVRAQELGFSNADAFATLTRKASNGQVPLRIAYFRKFWEGLDNMAYYWDNSLDEYLPPSMPPADIQETPGETSSLNEEEPRKKAKTEDSQATLVDSVSRTGFSPDRALPQRTASPKVPWIANLELSERAPDLAKGSYRGYRIGNGAEMPDQYRLDCVRAFLEPITWAFGVTFAQHRRPPVLIMEHMRFPVRMSSVAWRAPQDRIKARQGLVEGPVLGLQCRADVNFRSSDKLGADSTLDAVRELGGLLLLAQERARQGKVEKRGGEGKWWTTKARWGGGPGGEVGEGQGNNEISTQDGVKVEERPVERNKDGSKVRRRPNPAELWKVLKPSNPLWDPKIAYEAIGKDRTTQWDDVFMVSSLNHHISFLRLRVHPLYLQYLTEGQLPDKDTADAHWYLPILHRSRWYDLFDAGDRVEAMRGVWGIMSYLMRTVDETAMPGVA